MTLGSGEAEQEAPTSRDSANLLDSKSDPRDSDALVSLRVVPTAPDKIEPAIEPVSKDDDIPDSKSL